MLHDRLLVISISSVSEERDSPLKQATPAEGEEAKEEKAESKVESAAPKAGKKEPLKKKVTNQFNFCERASQTFNNALRVRGRITCIVHTQSCWMMMFSAFLPVLQCFLQERGLTHTHTFIC